MQSKRDVTVKFLSKTETTKAFCKRMTQNNVVTFAVLPIELVYRVFDHLDLFDIIASLRHVSNRLDQIIDSYASYNVRFVEIYSNKSFDKRHFCFVFFL